jgi:GABA(A) receptor-associated protein
MSKFKQTHTFDKRKIESDRITIKYENRIPIIVEVNAQNTKELNLDKFKYLVPHDLTLGQFLFVIRKRVKIEPEKALFIFFNNVLPPMSDSMGEIYNSSKDIDGFLYAVISLESTFG